LRKVTTKTAMPDSTIDADKRSMVDIQTQAIFGRVPAEQNHPTDVKLAPATRSARPDVRLR
jgi:hypothetical protein